MKKVINGKVVNIDNIKLFEKAEEGLAISRSAVSKTEEGIDSEMNSALVKDYIKSYDAFVKSMPFPLYAIESSVKYAALAEFLRLAVKSRKEKMWIADGLYIVINEETKMTLHMVNATWSINYVNRIDSDNTSLDAYELDDGYKEFKWLLKSIQNKKPANFYEQFMPDFLKACKGEPLVLQWELENILNFSRVPNKMTIATNSITDKDNNKEITIDIFKAGQRKTGRKKMVIELGQQTENEEETTEVYDFEAFEKSLTKDGDKPKPMQMIGLGGLFVKLCKIRADKGMTSFPEYRAFINSDHLTFEIDNRIFTCKARNLSNVKEIATEVEIIAYEKGYVYFSKKTPTASSKVNRVATYAYSLTSGTVRVCKIEYI